MPEFRWLEPGEAGEEAILRRILQQASQEIEGLSADPKLADPVVLLLLRAFAREFAELYLQVERTTDRAFRALVRRLLTFPRAPRPAQSVLQFQVSDPGVMVDESVMAVGRRAVAAGSGQEDLPIHFTPLRPYRLGDMVPGAVLMVTPAGEASLLQAGGDWRPGPATASPPGWTAPPTGGGLHLYVALDGAPPADETLSPGFFLDGDDRAGRACLWGAWERLGPGGTVEARLEPGRAITHHPRDPEPELFSFRSDTRVESSPFEARFIRLSAGGPVGSGSVAASGTPAGAGVPAGAAVPPGAGGPAAVAVPAPADGRRREWWRALLPPPADPEGIRALRLRGNCVPAMNRQVCRVSFNVAAVPEQSLTLPVTLQQLLSVEEIEDVGTGQVFKDRGEPGGYREPRGYRLREDADGRVALLLHDRLFGHRQARIQVRYATTLGEAANGLERGSVTALYENRPGLRGVTNVAPSAGGEAARPVPEQEEELRAVLRTHARCVVAQDYREMARLYDPRRVQAVEIRPGVTRGERGLRRCVEVLVRVAPGEFVSEGESEHFVRGLQRHLESRSPVTEAVRVRLAAPAAGR
jgi:hypothetical protein